MTPSRHILFSRPCASRCDEMGSLSDDTTHDILSKLPNRKLGFQRFRQNQDFVQKQLGFTPFDIFQEVRVFGFCSLTFSTSNETLKSTLALTYMHIKHKQQLTSPSIQLTSPSIKPFNLKPSNHIFSNGDVFMYP